MEITQDARCEFNFDYKTDFLQTGDVSLRGQETKCAIKLMTLDDFVQNMSDARFIWEMERLSKLEFGAVLIDTDWAKIVKKYYDHPARPEAVIGRMLALSVKYQIPIGPVSDIQGVVESALAEYAEGGKPTINFSRPPMLPLSIDEPNRYSLTGLHKVVVLEKWNHVTITLMQQTRIGVEPYILNKIAELPCYGVWFEPTQGIDTSKTEAQLRKLSQTLPLTLVIDQDKESAINRGLKALWKRLIQLLNMS